MEKEFNVTGTCRPARHYMADVSAQFAQILSLVDKGKYFVINRPRQYGKTTALYALANTLRKRGDYVVFNISFEGVGGLMFSNEKVFSQGFLDLLADDASVYAPELEAWIRKEALKVDSLKALSKSITELAHQTDKKGLLLIDEIDQSLNNQLFIDFLALLRNKYLAQETFKTFHSIVLAGLHDIKSLKLKLRPDDEKKYNSPWNIAAKFTVDMNLQPSEIKPMLDEYCADKGVIMDTQQMADRLFYHTSGYPFLVSSLCKIIDEEILPEKEEQTWTETDLKAAVRRLLMESNTNFDTLIKSLENDKALYDLVYRIIMEGDVVYFNLHEPLINMGLMHGIFKNEGQIKIHNRIYESLLYDYMTAKTTVAMQSYINYAEHFKLENNGLNMPAALLKFQQFMKEEFNEKDKTFLERQGRLVFLSFLTPVLNGKGQTFKEVQVSEEKRLDIVTTYFQHKYIIELKRWYGEEAHQRGLNQLADYLEIHSVKEGYLVIFEYNKVKSWRSDWIEHQGKRIFAVWV